MPDFFDNYISKLQPDNDLAAFKRVFLTDDGQYVLGMILEKCKFMDPCENERDMALNNFAKDLMATIYWDQNKKAVNIYRIIEFVRKKLKKEKS